VYRQFSIRGPAGSVALAAVAGFGHLIYPLYLIRKSSGTEAPTPPSPTTWPSISVIVPAYLEAAVIRAKVDDVLANGYPGTVEVIVAADDPETAVAAFASPATVLEAPARSGKGAALNRGVAAASHDVVVITDANTKLSPGALRQLARWMTEPSFDAVAGEKRVQGDRGESLYWRFESWLKQREFMTGSTIGLVGELAAIRRDRWRPLPDDVTNDDLWIALDIVSDGGRIAYEPNAVAFEEEASFEDEWERRTRVVAGALDVLWRRRADLVPGASPATPQIWGHRAARITAGPLAHVALLRRSLRSLHRSRSARAFFAAHAAAGTALYRQQRGETTTSVEKAGAQLLWLQLVALGGIWRFLRHESTVLWPKRERPAGSQAASAQR
jgi:cellulose synthase/poly-beta-1,6-N-acetylglucosamine synthase-like glycosyltransferase